MGYEEAACQGLIAGINAHQNINNLKPFTLSRKDAYIGVLIDDLVNKGTDEPYRMFTSRAEFRTLLRQDNADLRLTEKSYRIGLASQERMDRVVFKEKGVEEIKSLCLQSSILPEEANEYLASIGSATLSSKQKIFQVVLRPDVNLLELSNLNNDLAAVCAAFDKEIIEQAEIQLKYATYIDKEREMAKKMYALEEQVIPDSFDYDKILSLSNEARQKFHKIKPQTLGQASRISGVNPSDVQILMVYMGR